MLVTNYNKLMDSKPLVQLTPDYEGELKFGYLIGFNGLGGDKGITASYPIWAFVKEKQEIQFILFTKDNGQFVIDNTWLTSNDLFINDPPIKVDLQITKMPTTI